MLVKTYCAAVNGMEVTTVTVEVSITRGVMFHLTGLADVAVKESHDRIAAALLNNGYSFPVADITANLAPADLERKAPVSIYLSQLLFLVQPKKLVLTILKNICWWGN